MKLLSKVFWLSICVVAFLCVPKSALAADWTTVGFGENNVKTVFVDPGNSQRLIVSLSSYVDNNYNYFSENGGNTWQPISLGGSMTPCNNFAINPKGSNEVWAGCNTGLFRSLDGGKSFTSIDKYRYFSGVRVNISEDGVIYMASTGNNLHRSVDGIFWDVLAAPGASSNPVVFLNGHNAGEVYVSAMNSGLYKSTDAGSTWILVNSTAPVRNGVGQMTFDGTGKVCAAATNYGIGCSLDGGFTWSDFVSPNPASPHEYQHSYYLVQNPDDDANIIVFSRSWSGNDGKIYSYEEGSSLPTITNVSQLFGGLTISQGVVFAWSQSAGWTKGVWRNDGLVAVPEYLKKHPVIIVPGILGSWNVPYIGWEFDPFFKTYDELYNNFIMAGYEPGEYLFKFPYQWRAENAITAGLLKKRIDEVKAASGSDKVDIVTHSMGGIVARIYAQSDIYQDDIDQIIFIGTPHIGSTSAYPMWEAGDLTLVDPSMRAYLGILLKEESSRKFKDVVSYLREDVPSVKQLLPIYSYLSGKVYPEQYPRNEVLELLEANKSVLERRGVRATNIIGVGINTPSTVDILNGDFGIYWPDGKMTVSYKGDGDGTVLKSSQIDVPGNTVIKNGVKHGDLPRMSVNEVFKALGIQYSSSETVNTINKYLFIAAYSPVDFYVVAPDGKKIGFNKDGIDFNEIDGAFYAGSESETEFITIPNPLQGEYKVITYGTGTGSYEIEATFADDETSRTFSSSYTGQATPGKEDNILVKLEADIIETEINDKTAPVTTAVLSGTQAGEYYNSNVEVTLSADDTESGVEITEYSLDGIVWEAYSRPIILDQDGESIIYYRSTDKLGNIEKEKQVLFKVDKTAPTVSVVLEKSVFTRWDSLSVYCNVSDNYSGIKKFILLLDGVTVDCEQTISLLEQNIGDHIIEYSAIDNADNIVTGALGYKVVVNYTSLVRDIWWLYNNNHFRSRGDAISLLSHVEIASVFDMFGKAKSFLYKSQGMVYQQWYKGKLTSYGYDMITADIKYILEGEK